MTCQVCDSWKVAFNNLCGPCLQIVYYRSAATILNDLPLQFPHGSTDFF